MRAAILSIGDELTLGQALDTNSQWLAQKLAGQSIIAIEHRTVADDRPAIAAAIRDLAAEFDLLVITGGLGPTADDLTREAVGDVVAPGTPLLTDQAVLDHIVGLFRKRHRDMPDMNRKQAQRPESMRSVPNPNGTAPGIAGEIGRCKMFALPGPPREMQPMFLKQVLPALASPDHDANVLLSATVHEFGMGESIAAEKLGEVMARDRNPLVGTTVSDAIVSARVRVDGPRARAEQQLRSAVDFIERAWQPYAFGRNGETLSDSVATLLRRAGKTIATAESCTGGWLGKTIVDRPGSSKYYRGGWIAYSDEFKSEFLNVPAALIEKHGAVSAPVACALATEALLASAADYSLAITGVAGPDGGTPAKPVGTVLIALALRENERFAVTTRHFLFPGDRSTVRDRSVKSALQMMRFALLDVPPSTPLIWEVVHPDVEPSQAASIAPGKSSRR